MTWIDDNKGSGPWDFTEQKDKWGYLNNPRWSNNPKKEGDSMSAADFSTAKGLSLNPEDHRPCGHWHKHSDIPVEPLIPIYIEMHNYGFIQPETFDSEVQETERTIDTADYDGNATYYFEVLGNNHGMVSSGTYYPATDDYVVSLMNASTFEVYANITFEPETPLAYVEGEWTKTWQTLERKRVAFTPPTGETTFVLRFQARKTPSAEDPTGARPTLGAMRIIIKQDSSATKTKLQVPLQCVSDFGGNYNGGYYPNAMWYGDYDEPENHDWGLVYSAGIWLYNASELSTISKVVFETVAGSDGRLTVPDECQPFWSYYAGTALIEWGIALFTMAGVMVPGTSIISTELDGSTEFELDIWLDVPGDVAAGNYKVGFYRKALGGEEWVYSYPTYGYYYSVPADPYEGHIRWYVKGNPFWEEEIFGGLLHRLWWQEEEPVSVDAISVCLWDKDVDAMVTGSELAWASAELMSRKNTEIDVANLVDGHEYEMRVKVVNNGGTGCNITADTNLYIWLTPITTLTVWQRIAKGEYGDYAGISYLLPEDERVADDSRTLFEPPADYSVYFENVSLAYGWPTTVELQEKMYYELIDVGSANYGRDWNSISDAQLFWTEAEATNWFTIDEYESEKVRKRTDALSLTALNHFAELQVDRGAWMYQQQAFIIITQSVTAPTDINLDEPQVWTLPGE